LSQEELSLSAGIDRSYVSKIELARFSVSLDILEQLARALEVDPSELLAERGKR
jgi:transcriptional regulator with XRE-family HTH domain